MSTSPKVSVVMSVYNGAQHLAQTLDSVLGQQNCEFEFIVVNDGSTDETAAILSRYAAVDARLRVLRQENSGLTRALIRGCAASGGEFIARQDVGDLCLPHRFRKQVEAMEADRNLAFVSCCSRYVGPDGEFLFAESGTGSAALPIQILDDQAPHGVVDGPSHHGSVMFSKATYLKAGGYREEFYFGQDWDLWYRLARLGKFQLLPDVLYQARIELGDISISNKIVQEQLAGISLAAHRASLAGLDESNLLAEARRTQPLRRASSSRARTSKGCYFIGECLRRNGNSQSARKYFLKSVAHDPRNLKAWFRLAHVLCMARDS